METIVVNLIGQSPLMMHNSRLANPLDPITKQMHAIATKRKKTEADLAELAWYEFQGSLYCDEKTGPYIPGHALDAAVRGAARRHQRGKDVERGVVILDDKIALQYRGPRDPKGLYGIQSFVDMRIVCVDRKRIMRCRPIFMEWGCRASFGFDDTIINRHDLLQFITESGSACGLLEMRPRYGRYAVTEVE